MKVTLATLKAWLAIILVIVVVLPLQDFSVVPLYLTFIFSLVFFIALYNIYLEMKFASFSLNIIHWVFVVFFFVLTPLINVATGYNQWGIVASNEDVFLSAVLVLVWELCYMYGNRLGKKIKFTGFYVKSRVNCLYEPNSFDIISNRQIFIMTCISLLLGLIYIQTVGFWNLFVRSTASVSFTGTNARAANLLFGKVIHSSVAFTTALSVMSFVMSKRHLAYMVLNGVLCLLVCCPTGLPRNEMGMVYLGLAIVFFFPKIQKYRKKATHLLTFLAGFMIVFPVINVFRKSAFWEAKVLDKFISLFENVTYTYNSADYDAFSMITNTVTYVEQFDFSYGMQLIGSLLFFVPRSIWIAKPYGTGQTVFEYLHPSYTNVSSPLIAEGYINFGVLGVVLFAMVIGFLCTKVDRVFWKSITNHGVQFNFITMIYPFLLFSYFFMLRGDLMSTWAYMFAYVVVFLGWSLMLQHLKCRC